MSDKEWWDEVFSDPEHVFTHPEDHELIDMISERVPRGDVLDLGCGEAGTALALAAKGYSVTTVDISRAALVAVDARAAREGVRVMTLERDLESYAPEEDYDIVLFLGVLHLLDEDTGERLITVAKAATRTGGVHVLEAWSDWDEGFSAESLGRLYSDWNVLEAAEYAEDGRTIKSLLLQKQ